MAALAACSSTPPFKPASPELPARVSIDVKHFPQTPYHCGPAALATSLQAAGIETHPDQLSRSLYIPDKRGSFALELKARARRFDVMAYQPDADPDNLLAHLASGTPVLVLQNLGLGWLPQWHFAVAVGYDLPERQMLLHSGPDAYLRTDIDLFLKTWRRGDYWALVVVPADHIPDAAPAQRWTDAASELEQTGNPGAALLAYGAATKRWPAIAENWFGQGNVLYTMRRFDEARDSLQVYTELQPGDAAGWNNLAYALQASGCRQAALHSAHCATRLAPDQTRYLASLKEITAAKTQRGGSGRFCPVATCPVR